MIVEPSISSWLSVILAGAEMAKGGVGESIGNPNPPIRLQSWNAIQCTSSSGSTQQNTGKPDSARISSRAERSVVFVHLSLDSPVTGSVITLVGIQLWTKVAVPSAPPEG